VEELTSRARIALPGDFRYGEVPSDTRAPSPVPPPSLGPLAAFVGSWKGHGFNTIFRPDSQSTPTPLPIPVGGSDNVLELNLTSESLTFSPSLGAVPNRGSSTQADIFLNGVPYLQAVDDVTVPNQTVGIHVEPGLWMIVPPTTHPELGVTLVRMGSIPHGTTIVAQGTSRVITGPPTIPAVDITPRDHHGNKVPTLSQGAARPGTARIPQDLTAYIAAGTITQAILDDPNTVLRDAITGQKIVSTTEISISTSPAKPLFGGGADNIAFLMGDPTAAAPNADVPRMSATFWIETVEHTIEIPIFTPGQPPLIVHGPTPAVPGQPVRKYFVNPPFPVPKPRTVTFTSTQIQYSQLVMLHFFTLDWPHVSVATLVPADPIPVPPAAWE
jgi:hypothetical protein